MAQSESKEFRAKIIMMGGTLRGWIPTGVPRELKARGGDYLVFRMNKNGKFTVAASRPTLSEKKKAAARRRSPNK